jgi:signal transduction histidine kinase
MAGRRALWLFYLWLVLALAAGVLFDVHALADGEAWLPYAVDGMISAAIFLFVAVVVDRSSSTLRRTLAAARARGDELACAKARLETEIAERERIHEQLVHSQKVEIVGRLAAGVAHDFNHLLTLIIGYAAQGRGGDEPVRLRELLGNIDAVARRASLVSRRLTGFARRDAVVPEVFDVNSAVEEMQPSLRQLLGPDVRVAFAPTAAAHAIRIDRSQFELVVLNIAANAGEAMPEGGRLVIEVHALDTVPAGVELRFSDTGHGMDEATRQRVFEPFFTTRAAGRGTGLGLAVAADVIAACGGRIVVESAPGRGATFRLQLPLAVDDVEMA